MKKNTDLSTFQALTTCRTNRRWKFSRCIVAGSPNAAFWMLVFAVFGMSTIFAEAVLAQKYRRKINRQLVGSPAYYIRDGLNSKVFVIIFTVLLILRYGITEIMVHSNTISHAFKTTSNMPTFLVVYTKND